MMTNKKRFIAEVSDHFRAFAIHGDGVDSHLYQLIRDYVDIVTRRGLLHTLNHLEECSFHGAEKFVKKTES